MRATSLTVIMGKSCSADDRETPLVAVQDITLVISILFDQNLQDVRVYDPYYCQGTIISMLTKCGFNKNNIHNEDKDCYTVQKTNDVPPNDIIITNPPYSGNQIKYCSLLSLMHHGTQYIFISIYRQVITSNEPSIMRVRILICL